MNERDSVCLCACQQVTSSLCNAFSVFFSSDQWFPDEINTGHLDWFCFLLCGLLIANLLFFFVPVSLRYKYVRSDAEFGRQHGDAASSPVQPQQKIGAIFKELSQEEAKS